MAKDKYFDLRQSSRAYQNPYEAGGIGVGGLTQSARYNRQQVGSSFLSAPTGVNTWAKSPNSRSMGRGGMVSMPTDGPTPQGGAPDRPQRMGPAGPSTMASGVAGRFDRPSENTFKTTGVAGNVVGKLTASGFIAGNAARKARKAKREALKGYEDYDVSATLSRKRQNFPAGKFPLEPMNDSGIEDPTRPVRPALAKYNQKKYNYEPSYNTNTNDLDPVLNEDPGLVGPGHWDFGYGGSVRVLNKKATPPPQGTLFSLEEDDTISVGGYNPSASTPASTPAVTSKPNSRASGRSIIEESIDRAQASGFDPIASANRAQEELARKQGLGASSPNQDFNTLYDKLYGKRPYDWGLDQEEGGLG